MQNIHSRMGFYTQDSIRQLKNIKRFWSFDDMYQSKGTSMLQDIMKNNKLQYLSVENWYINTNVLKPMTLSENIENLKYIFIMQYQAKYQVNIDVTNQYPSNLHLCFIESNGKRTLFNEDDPMPGKITGAQNLIQKLKQQLLHDFDQKPVSKRNDDIMQKLLQMIIKEKQSSNKM